VESAYQWLCHARHTAHPNHPVWHFRWNWNTWKTRLLTHLKSAHPSYRLSPVRRVLTAAGERLECWEPQDSLMLKLLAEHLQPVLLPGLSSHCHHLKGRGGIKRAVHHVRQTIETGDYPFVARSDAKGYYANIQHTRLLELLRVHCREAWVLDLASQYCGRTLEQDGYYRTVTKGISLGCPLSPLMGALYLSPLDEAISPTLAEVAAQPHRPAASRGLHPAGCHPAARHASAVPVTPFSPTAIHAGGACT
jgi:hypothetical protein